MKKAVRGFTLVELVIVLVVVSILAAVAIARFADVQSQARQAVVEQVAGAMKSQSAIFHSYALTNAIDSGTVTFEGNEVSVIGGYLQGHWEDAWRHVFDVGMDISFSNWTSECTKNDLCGVGNRTASELGLAGTISGSGRHAVAIWLKGDYLADDCFAYYYNQGDGSDPYIGSITDGC